MGNCLAIMGNCLPISLLTEPATILPEAFSISKKKKRAVPIETPFVLPSPLPSWPSGGGFAKGSIDLGGLEVCQVSTFTKIWASSDGGPDNLGATFFAPSPIPDGFFMLGSYAQPNNKALFGWVLAARPTSDSTTLAEPVGYTLVWNSGSDGHFWLPVPPEGYKAVGHIVTSSSEKPALSDVRCVRADLTDNCEVDTLVWGSTDKNGGGVNVYGLRPAARGVQALGVWTGTFMVTTTQNGDPIITSTTLACLKNKDSNLTSMPNLTQINALMQAYSPIIYFHPDEKYLPSSVSWFFNNGALLYKQADNTHPTAIDPTGSNLPQGGGNDGAYWLDLPKDDGEKNNVKSGDLATAEAYLHVKPMLGATHTDIAIWVFYPFNGPAKAKLGLLNLPLGKIGEHVGDWEHVTLRVSNLTGELWRLYLSEHGGGAWVDASQLEFEAGGGSNKAAVYASLNGHAFYAKPGLVLQGDAKIGVGIRNDAAKGKWEMDTGAKFAVAAADYLAAAVVPPPWLEYMREWGPKISYDVESELRVVEKLLPSKLRNELERVVKSLPDEVLGEEGPTGPKTKDNWNNDEKVGS